MKYTDITWDLDLHTEMQEEITAQWIVLATELDFDNLSFLTQDFIVQRFQYTLRKSLTPKT